jgi:polysaccharide export outer membrane protein
VFLFRLVPKATLQKAGVDVSRFAGPLVPTIFNTDWSRPGGLFLANDFYLQHRDIIFVSNAPTQDISKYLSFINEVLGTVSNVVGTGERCGDLYRRGTGSGGGSATTGVTTPVVTAQ